MMVVLGSIQRMVNNSHSAGAKAEQLAEQFLLQHGLTTLRRNYRCRYGEIDLIMLDKSVLVFVEVRLRGSLYFGGAASSIDYAKKQKILRTAQHFLSTVNTVPQCRFDAVLFMKTGLDGMEWIQNALAADFTKY